MVNLWLVHGLFLASGATALVYQVAWQRRLSLVFGASFEAVSIVLAAFMGGLAAGGVYFGRRAERSDRPLLLYGVLEIGVALFALALPALLRWLDAGYSAIALQSDGADASLNAARLILAFGVLLLPTFFMGGTLPVLVRTLVHHTGELGARLAGLYSINTAGAVIGTLSAGFVLLPRMGVRRTEVFAIGVNLAIGAAAIAIDRFSATGGSSRPVAAAPARPRPGHSESAGPGEWALPLRLAFWGTGVAGMTALILEVAWSRAIAIACGANTYSFTVMLAAFLIGIALGSRLHGIVASSRYGVCVQFGGVMLGIGLASALVSHSIPRLPELAIWLGTASRSVGPEVQVGTTFALSFLVMLAPCIAMGMAFPLAGEARSALDSRFGASVGDLVGLNTAGAIVGSLSAGFVLIPRLGLQQTMLLAAALYCGYGLVVLAASWAVARPRARGVASIGAASALPVAVTLALAIPAWDPRLLAAATNNDRSMFVDAEGRIDFDWGMSRTELLYLREGRGSLVSVIRNGDVRSLLINGKVVATDDLGDMQHEYLLGHLPTLLHPNPKSAIVVGLGAGLTLGGVAAEPSLERIVVVEIEPAVEGAARIFGDLNGEALDDPRVEIAWQDGRNYLATTSARFDVITADPIHPWAQGASYLYTIEYYAMISDRLRPGGVACQWLPLYELSEDDLKSVVAAFLPNFEHASLWQATGDLLLIGSNAPIAIDLDHLAARTARPETSRQLARAGLDDPLSFLAEFTLDKAAMERFAAGAIVNTDDNLHLEFSSPLSIGIDPRRHLPLFDRLRMNANAVVREAGERFGTPKEIAAVLAGFGAAKSRIIEATPHWFEQSAAPTVSGLTALVSEYEAALEVGPGYRPAEVLLARTRSFLGDVYLAAGNRQSALHWYRRALQADPGNATANLHIGVALSGRGETSQALAHFEQAAWRKPQSVDAQAAAGQALMQLGRYGEARERLDAAVRIGPEIAEVQRLRCECLRHLGAEAAATEACR